MKTHPLIFYLCAAVGLALGLAGSAHLQLSSLKTQIGVMAKIMLDQSNRCACIPVEKK